MRPFLGTLGINGRIHDFKQDHLTAYLGYEMFTDEGFKSAQA